MKKQWIAALVLAVVVAVASSVGAMCAKEGWHIDEAATLALANGSQNGFITAYDDSRYGRGAFLHDTVFGDSLSEMMANIRTLLGEIRRVGFSGYNVRGRYLAYREGGTPIWKTGEEFRSFYMADHGFSLRDVYVNQMLDNHPPLYYLFVRAAYSLFGLFGGRDFTLWPAFCVNVLFVIGCVWMCLRIGRRLGSVPMGLAAALLFALTPAGRTLADYMRMYIALCFFVLWSLDAHLELRAAGWRFTRSLGWRMVLATALGFYTHYYFVIWAAFEALFALVCMAREGQARRIGGYIGRMIGAAALSLAIWPISVVHVLFSYRGQEAAASLGSGGPLEAIRSGWAYFSRYLFGPMAWMPLLLAALAAAGILVRREPREKGAARSASPIHLILWPALLYLAVAFVISPYEDIRYMTCAVPMACLAVAWCLDRFGRLLPEKAGRLAAPALAAAIAIPAMLLQPQLYSYPGEREARSFVAEHTGATCVYVTSSGAAFYREMPDFAHYDRVLILLPEEISLLAEDETAHAADELLVYVHVRLDQAETLAAVREATGMASTEVLCGSTPALDAQVYLLGRGES